MERQDFAIRAGRREDAEEAARLWMQSAEEHTSHDPVYATAPGAEKTMRRFLADLARNGYAFVFVATVGERMVGFVSGEMREGSRPSSRRPGPPWTTSSSTPTTATKA